MLGKQSTTPGYPATGDFSCANANSWQYYNSEIRCDTTSSTTITVIRLNGGWNGWLLTEIPSALGLFTNLKYLEIQEHDVQGTLPSWLYTSYPFLTDLRLQRLNKAGTVASLRSLPSAIGGLTALTWLDLTSSFSGGTIPDYSNLQRLASLQLSSNKLTGSIPSWIGLLQLTHYMELHRNSLVGTIPSALGLLTKLTAVGGVWGINNNKVSEGRGVSVRAFEYSLTPFARLKIKFPPPPTAHGHSTLLSG